MSAVLKADHLRLAKTAQQRFSELMAARQQKINDTCQLIRELGGQHGMPAHDALTILYSLDASIDWRMHSESDHDRFLSVITEMEGDEG